MLLSSPEFKSCTDSLQQVSTTTGTIQTTHSRHYHYKRTEQNDLTLLTDRDRPITTDLRHSCLTANYITAKLTNQFIQTGLRTFDWQQLFTWLWWWLPLRLSKRQSPLPTTVQDCTHPNDQTTVLHATYILFVSTSIPLMHIYPIFSVRKDFHCFSPLWTARRTGHSQRLHRKWRRIVCTASSARRNDRAERVWGNPNNNLLTTIHRGGEGKWLIFTTVTEVNSCLSLYLIAR